MRDSLIFMGIPEQAEEDPEAMVKNLKKDRALHSISKGVPCHPAEEAPLSRLYPGFRSFGHDPKFMTIEGRNVDCDDQ